MKRYGLELIAVSVSVLTLILMYEKHKIDKRMSEEQRELRELQAELYKHQISSIQNAHTT